MAAEDSAELVAVTVVQGGARTISTSAPGVKKTVLVVDDDPTNRRLVSAILKKAGYRALVADGGVQALEVLGSSRPWVIIMDYMMPGMDGPETIRRLRRLEGHEETPVILLTASDSAEHIGEAFEAGAQDFLTRPVNVKILTARVASAIELTVVRSRAERDRSRQRGLLDELEEARQVQQSQIPELPLDWLGWRAAGAVVPSGRIGGDLIAIDMMTSERTVLALVDVSGHGVAAALVASQIVAEFRGALVGRSLAGAVMFLNDKILSYGASKYAAIAAIETSMEEVSIVNAGLPPVILIRDGAVVVEVAGSGVPPGLLPKQDYVETVLPVRVGDRLVLMSDGLTEPFGDADNAAGQCGALNLLQEDWDSYFVGCGSADARIRSRLGDDRPDDATLLLLERSATQKAQSKKFHASPGNIASIVAWIEQQLPTWALTELISLGITEAVTNAVVHGALGRQSQGRAERMAEYASPPVGAMRHVFVAVSEEAEVVRVQVEWEGVACPPEWQTLPECIDPLAESGRGLQIIHGVFDEVNWRNSGLLVELVTRRTHGKNSLR